MGSTSGDYEAFGSFVIECEGNSDNVVWKRDKNQSLVVPLGQYWKEPFNYTISTTNYGKLVYHGRVVENDSSNVPGERVSGDDLIGSYDGHTMNFKDIIDKEYVHTFQGVDADHKVEISIKLTKKE